MSTLIFKIFKKYFFTPILVALLRPQKHYFFSFIKSNKEKTEQINGEAKIQYSGKTEKNKEPKIKKGNIKNKKSKQMPSIKN